MSYDESKELNGYESLHKSMIGNEKIKKINIILPFLVVAAIIVVMVGYTHMQRKEVIANAEQVTNQMAEYIAENVAKEVNYAESSIKLAAVTISQTMDSAELNNPAEIILPMVDNTPFASMEYIRPDGMNVMNIGEPFDASNRVYYIEGIQGKTGIWNNYHPKTSKDTLVNFYTPLLYQGEVAGVLTGYIEAKSQLAALFETKLYGQDIYGIIVDDEDMVICSTMAVEYVSDMTLDMFMDYFPTTADQKLRACEIIHKADSSAVSYKDPSGQGRICVATVPGTSWRVAIIVPAKSFGKIIYKSTRESVFAVVIVGLILFAYAAYVLLRNVRRRRLIAAENAKLEEENRIINKENQKVFDEITGIRDVIASANMGTWRIELVDGEEPRMFVDDTMKSLLGIAGQEKTPEETYTGWFSRIVPDAVPSVLRSVERMEQGFTDENTYLWNHPTKGDRYVRCGGTAQKIPGGYSLRGYHYDVDDVVREDQAKVAMLKDALDDKNEYYDTLGTLGGIFNSVHVINLKEDTTKEFSATNAVRQVVNRKEGAVQMMVDVMTSISVPEYKEAALEFTDLTTLADRMQHKKMMTRQLISRNIGWFLAGFITMEADEDGRPTKVIYTTRSIDEEKKQEETLIHKSQTDELTRLLNRRAYEEDIYAHNDIPQEDNFVYVSLDANGLKIVNDTQGHAAGDELLVAASQCMRTCLGPYGKVYRTGGDEFVAILFCDDKKLKDVLADFDEALAGYSGQYIDNVSVSYGWISKEENADLSVREMGAIADKRMYEAKSAHYRKAGVDRRGQQDAHKALCGLYTKILKINISEDTYSIVNMDAEEQTQEKGFAASISEWLISFGKSGQVHPDDLEEYLKLTSIENMRQHFASGKTSLHVFYRRKCENRFCRVMMEIIPANDYSMDNQSLFLYVKNLDE